MLRKLIVAAAAIASLTAVSLPTQASAQGWHGHRGGGWHGGYHRGWGGRGWGGAGFYGPRLGFYGAPAYAYGGGCWQSRRVGTPYGWRWRRVWVCG